MAWESKTRKCSVPDCDRAFSSSVNGVAYCNMHYQRMRNNGTTDFVGKKTKHTHIVCGDYTVIYTTKHETFLVDTADSARVLQHTWCKNKNGYFVATINRKLVPLHRFIVGEIALGLTVDHISGDTSDNMRRNLRVCTPSENAKNVQKKKSNTSGHPGVDRLPNGRYRARITVDRKEINLGHYSNIEDAIQARKDGADRYYGEFAPKYYSDIPRIEVEVLPL